jgi:hypothetical protein
MTRTKFAPERWLWTAALIAIAAAAGCSGSRPAGRPPVYPSAGTVTLDGRPLAGATVLFQPVDPAGKPGTAVTDADGRFTAQTFDPGDGLTEGGHRVAVQKSGFVDKQGNPVREIREPGDAKEVHETPKKYEDFQTSGIEVKVSPGKGNEFQPFNLTTKK